MTSRRIAVRRSGIHGRGVFAQLPLEARERIFEYEGERIDWDEALRRHPHDPEQPNHTFYFALEDGRVIDGLHGGNSSRWINHSCAPNCEAEEIDGRVFIHTARAIAAGEELYYDYGLVLEGKHTKQVKRDYLCLCGAEACRGTMLAPKTKPTKPAKTKTSEKSAKAKKVAKAEKGDKKPKADKKTSPKPQSKKAR